MLIPVLDLEPAPRNQERRMTRFKSNRVFWPVAAAITAGVAAVARYGYVFGTHDHVVLTPKGISLADSGAFQNDWFTHEVPQPHWSFDVVTFLGEQFDVLPVTYLIYWLVALLAFGTASAWLVQRFLPSHQAASLLVGPLLVAGPSATLGSTTPLLAIALPHVLGGCLAFLALAALLTDRWRAAIIASALTWVVHVQHGFNLAPVLLMAGTVMIHAPRRWRAAMAASGILFIIGAAAVASLRGIETSGSEWLEICATVIPYHCNANAWPLIYIASGAIVAGISLSFALVHRKDWRKTAPTIVLPAVGLVGAVIADLFDLPFFGELAQQMNVYRLVAFVLPMAAFALVTFLSQSLRQSGVLWRLGLIIVGTAWVAARNAALHDLAAFSTVATAVVSIGGVVILSQRRRQGLSTTFLEPHSQPQRETAPTILVVCMVVTTLAVAQGGLPPAHIGYNIHDPGVAAALSLGRALPEGTVIAAPPGIYWLRAVSRRAVVADCKNVPYGGELWRQYQHRIADLGGRNCQPEEGGFTELDPAAVEALRDKYGVTHVLLFSDDKKMAYGTQHWRLVWQAGPAPRSFMWVGWSLFELPH